MVIGPRGLKDGKLEVKWRWQDEPEMIEPKEFDFGQWFCVYLQLRDAGG